MTKKQTAKTNMYLGLMLYLNGTMNIWQVLAMFETIFNNFKDKLSNLQKMQAQQETILTGYAMQKRDARIAMAESAFIIKGALQTFASDTNNNIIYMNVNWSLSDLIDCASLTSKDRCQVIHDQALAVINDLASYAVVQADLDSLLTKILAYNTIISGSKKVIGVRKQITKDIKKEIQDIDKLLKTKMDKLVANWKSSEPNFYNTYFVERKIYEAKTNFTEIIAMFKNKTTGHEVEGVLFKGIGNKGGSFEVVSSTTGVADKKQISPETYNLQWEIPGFESGSMNKVKVSPGEKEQLVIELVPVS